MRLLVIGGGGQLGTKIVEQARDRFEVYATYLTRSPLLDQSNIFQIDFPSVLVDTPALNPRYSKVLRIFWQCGMIPCNPIEMAQFDVVAVGVRVSENGPFWSQEELTQKVRWLRTYSKEVLGVVAGADSGTWVSQAQQDID